MKLKLKKLIVSLLTLLMLISSFNMPIFAEDTATDEIQPYLSNVFTYTVDFGITSTGFASVYFDYEGKSDVITGATAEIYLEKRFLGIFWSRVDIGETDDVWIDTFSEEYGYVVHTLQLEKTGTYRAKFKLTFTGTNTEDDVLEKTVEAKYE